MDGIAVANQMFDAVEQNDSTKFDEVRTADAVMWHGFRPHEESKLADTGKRLGQLHKVLKNMTYANRRYELLEGGDVLGRHTLTGTTVLGAKVEAHMMVRLTLKNGKVTRVDEFVDTASLKPIYEAMQTLTA